jgi:hypothetical protein
MSRTSASGCPAAYILAMVDLPHAGGPLIRIRRGTTPQPKAVPRTRPQPKSRARTARHPAPGRPGLAHHPVSWQLPWSGLRPPRYQAPGRAGQPDPSVPGRQRGRGDDRRDNQARDRSTCQAGPSLRCVSACSHPARPDRGCGDLRAVAGRAACLMKAGQ